MGFVSKRASCRWVLPIAGLWSRTSGHLNFRNEDMPVPRPASRSMQRQKYQGVIVNVAESDAVGSKTEVAVTVTEAFGGTVGGALYWTELGVWSVSAPAPVMLQVTPRFL